MYAVPDKPPGSSVGGNSSPTFLGANTYTSDQTLSDANFSSTISAQNALLISGGTTILTNPIITKSGDANDENSDFYGTNAAVLCYNGATLNITGGTVNTNGGHANGVFAYNNGTINIENTKINTTGNNSGGVMVTGGGILTAKNLEVLTKGNSSASIRSDRGGGKLTVTGGTYETNGVGSPAIYSTADTTVNNATLKSTASEGVVIEGSNSVTLNNTKLTDTNNTLNGNSETYKNIFIYQSMSGDADEETGTFNSTNSTFETNKGDTFFVTNTTVVINLNNNKFINNDSEGVFLRSQTGKWGNSGSNGGLVTLNMTNEDVKGDIVIDNISTLNMKLEENSYYKGAINNSNTAKNISITLNDNSVIVLDDDSYINNLSNTKEDNSNIYLNGHKLIVNNEEVSGNNDTPPTGRTESEKENKAATTKKATSEKTNTNSFSVLYIIIPIGLIFIILLILFLIKRRKNKKVTI